MPGTDILSPAVITETTLKSYPEVTASTSHLRPDGTLPANTTVT